MPTVMAPPASKQHATLALRNGPAVTQGKRTHASFLHSGLLARPGLEALRHIHTGRSPQPPVHYLSGRRLVAGRRRASYISRRLSIRAESISTVDGAVDTAAARRLCLTVSSKASTSSSISCRTLPEAHK